MATTSSIPPWERGAWGRLHRWGAQNPKWYYVYPPSLWAVFIYVTCMVDLKPVEESGWIPPIPGLDKIVHGVYYGLLSMLIIRGWQREKMPPIGLHAFVWGMCVLFGTMIEIHQGLTGYRAFEVVDILADAVGALAGQIAWHRMMIRWGKRTRLYPGLFRE